MSQPATQTPVDYRVIAHNYAFDSDNKIHSDDIASKYGFKGGLVPGVADFAYLARAIYDTWGEAWLSGGTLEARLFKPLYHGELARARVESRNDGTELELQLLNPAGELCAGGRAELSGHDEQPSEEAFPREEPPSTPRDPSVDTFPSGLVLGAYEYQYDRAAQAAAAAQMFVEPLPCTRDGATPWHPALCLHDANRILRANIILGPWIHTGSRVRYFGEPRDGERISLRGRVIETFEKKGHVMTEVDLGLFAAKRGIARIRHSAIIRLRDTP